MIHLGAAFLAGFPAQFFGDLQIHQIIHAAAAAADKVDMGFYVGVEPFHAVYRADADDPALFLKLGEVAVNGAETEIGVLWFELQVDPLGTGMDRGVGERF